MPYVPVNGPSTYGALSVTTSATEVKVGASALEERIVVSIQPLDGDVFLGYDNSVTTSTGTKIFKGQYVELERTNTVALWLIAAATVDVRIAELA